MRYPVIVNEKKADVILLYTCRNNMSTCNNLKNTLIFASSIFRSPYLNHIWIIKNKFFPAKDHEKNEPLTLLSEAHSAETGLVGFEPTKWRSQSPLPYRLAIAQYSQPIYFSATNWNYKASLWKKQALFSKTLCAGEQLCCDPSGMADRSYYLRQTAG